jgi:glycosyltransferase involved in cell wall biosynthesis
MPSVNSAPDLSTPCPVAVVAIGRNEGPRLRQCLQSAGSASLLVYVDSASDDDSVEIARSLGAHVVALDMSKPFSAARARNEGWRAALERRPDIQFIQFVDGDCEIEATWMDAALRALTAQPELSAVCGRRRERHPEHSVYNRLCDLEWNTPVGAAKAFGGDVMVRAQVLRDTGGYRDDVIAGEEPEWCVRIRAKGGQIWRLDEPMTLHDAHILHFRQWWTRAKRGGYAYALGAAIHGSPPERHWVAEYRRACLWGFWMPLTFTALTVTHTMGALAWLTYVAQWIRLGLRGEPDRQLAWVVATFSVIGKFAEAQGSLKFWRDRLTGRAATIIEYK